MMPVPPSGQERGDRARHRPYARFRAHLPFFALFAAFPVIVVTLYFTFFATDEYVCNSSLSIQSQHGTGGTGMAEALGTFGIGGGSSKDLHIVDEYIHSPVILEKLQAAHDLRAEYGAKSVDFVARLPHDASAEDFLDYYNAKIHTRLSADSGLLFLSVRSYSPAFCEALSRSIFSEAEAFVNAMSFKIQEDFMRFAREQLSAAETEMKQARDNLTLYQNDRNLIDPEKTAGNAISLIGELQQELVRLQMEMAEKLRIHNKNSPVIEGLKAREKVVRRQIAEETSRLTGSRPKEGEVMSENLAEYQSLLLQIDFARKRYELALALWETAQAEALRKTRYLVPVSEPYVPQDARGLNRPKEVAGYVAAILIAYLIAALMVLSVRDHLES